jgi:hypothetical protein
LIKKGYEVNADLIFEKTKIDRKTKLAENKEFREIK